MGNTNMAPIAPGDAPGLVSSIDNRVVVYNHNFGGVMLSIGETEAYNNTTTAGLLFDPLGMITLNRVCCMICCSATCPLKYADDKRTYEYSMKSSGCCCCKKAWMQVNRGSSADVESKKPGAEDTPIAFTHLYKQGCCAGQETFAVGDMEAEPDGSFKKGPFKYGIRNKPSCFKVGLCAGYATERAACSAITEGNIIMHTMMPIYRNPTGKPANAEASSVAAYGTEKDWEQRSEVVGTVTVQNLLVPCFLCCAVPSLCPLNTKVDLNKEYAATLNDDEKMKLGLFSHASVPMVPVPGANFYPGVMPLPFKWFGMQTLMIIGYAFGYGNSNVEYRFTGLKEAFANGLAETGDLIPRAIDGVKNAIAKAKGGA